MTECRRAVDFYYHNYPDQSIDSLYLSGGSCRIPGLDKVLQGKPGDPGADFQSYFPRPVRCETVRPGLRGLHRSANGHLPWAGFKKDERKMIQINLLPVRVQKRKEGARQFASVYFLTVAACRGGYRVFVDFRQQSNRVPTTRTCLRSSRRWANTPSSSRPCSNSRKRKELIDRKRQIIKDLQSDRDAWSGCLPFFRSRSPPEKMWFDKLVQTGNSVTIDGVAQSNEAIVEFMRNLESSPYIEKGSINLVQSKQFASKGNETEGIPVDVPIFIHFPKCKRN